MMTLSGEERQMVKIAAVDGTVLSVTSTRRRRSTYEGGDNTSTISGSSSTAPRRWISFPHDKLVAFGVSNFDGASLSSTTWSWDNDWDRNPNGESFVCEDEKNVLRHMTYLEGLCLRQEIRGPIGRQLSSELSHQSVPEFSTFWSSKPITASLSKKSIKVLLFIIAAGFTYMADLSHVIYLLRGNGTNDNPGYVAVHTMLLDVTTDPLDAALQARRPIRLSKTGALVGHPSSFANTLPNTLPFGSVDGLVSHYSVFDEDHHFLTYSQPISKHRYWELQGRHPTRDHYFVFLSKVDIHLSQHDLDSVEESGHKVRGHKVHVDSFDNASGVNINIISLILASIVIIYNFIYIFLNHLNQ